MIEGILEHKKRRTNSCESILRFSDLDRIQTCNLLSRNQVRYSVAPRGLIEGANITAFRAIAKTTEIIY